MHANLPEGEQPVLRIIPMPADTNAHGTIFGGWVMAQVDLAGSVPAYERAQGPVVTLAVNSFLFKEPVFVGDLVSFYARVVRVGRTSVTVDVEVFAQRGRFGRVDPVRVTEAQLTYVAIDEHRKPRPIPGGFEKA
jgi:acyl-CoA thioesterase YciA